jgi:DnaJ-class molecular chaperone
VTRDFDKLLRHFEDIEPLLTTEQCPICRGTGTETIDFTRPCQRCKGEGRITERPHFAEKKQFRGQRPKSRRK